MSLHENLHVLRERWKLVLVSLALGIAAAGAVTWFSTPSYTAEVTLFVAARDPDGTAAQAYQGSLLSQQKVKSYTQLVTSSRVLREVEQQGLAVSPSAITASVRAGTVLLTVSASDPSPERARRIADTVAGSFSSLVAELEKPAGGGEPAVTARVVEPAATPTAPTSPQPVRNLLLGALVGLLAGVGAAFVRNALDTSVKSVEALRDLVDAPSLGSVAYDATVPAAPLIVHEGPGASRSESLRQIRTNLQFVDVDNPVKVVVITSSLPGEGKTTTACNLAITLAQAGKKVVLVDADLRRARVGDYLGLERAVGVTSVLIDHTSLEHALQPWGRDGLTVLASGQIPPNPSELLASQHMADLLDELERRFDVVLVDTPPLLPVTDAAILAGRCDGALLVVRHGKTSRNQVKAAAAALNSVSARLLGTVMTMTPKSGSAEGYQYYQGYDSQPVTTTWKPAPPQASPSEPLTWSEQAPPTATRR